MLGRFRAGCSRTLVSFVVVVLITSERAFATQLDTRSDRIVLCGDAVITAGGAVDELLVSLKILLAGWKEEHRLPP